MMSSLKRVEEALAQLRAGNMVILADHPERENEGDFIVAAECITAEHINQMIKEGSGIICLSLPDQILQRLEIPDMIPRHLNTSHRGTPFTVSIEAKQGVTTGVSAQDRVTTILAAIDPKASKDTLAMPGHVFPLRACDGGVFERPGHTEGGLDLVRLAGMQPAAVLCEVMNADGSMMKGERLAEFAKEKKYPLITIEDLIYYRRFHENLIDEEVTCQIPLEKYGLFNFSVIREKYSGLEHVVISNLQENEKDIKPVVRIHSSCVTGDIFASHRCDCHKQLHYALEQISLSKGILIYLNQEGRGIGLFNKIKAYVLQQQGVNTVDANLKLGLPVDGREYYIAANVLRNRGIKKVSLLSNNPKKVSALAQFNILVDMIQMPVFCNQYNENYLRTKKDILNHNISFGD